MGAGRFQTRRKAQEKNLVAQTLLAQQADAPAGESGRQSTRQDRAAIVLPEAEVRRPVGVRGPALRQIAVREQGRVRELVHRNRVRLQLQAPVEPAQSLFHPAVLDQRGHARFDGPGVRRRQSCRLAVMHQCFAQPSLVTERRAEIGMCLAHFRRRGNHLAQHALGFLETPDVYQH
jgi:hypothetical protein